MIITKTPFRVSLFGGGTDFPAWFEPHGGLCVGLAITQYAYVLCRKLPSFFDYDYKLVYSKIEETRTLESIQHPTIRECLQTYKKDYGVNDQLEIHHVGDIPARTGTGSSSTFLVGLINALNLLYKIKSSNHDMAALANWIEREHLKESGGYQDAIWAAYGGLNSIEFKKSAGPFSCFNVKPIVVSDNDYDYLTDSLVLFYTGMTRNAHEVTQTYVDNILNKYDTYKNLVDIAQQSIRHIQQLDVKNIGRLLNDSWLQKKSISNNISNSKIDELYQEGLKNGALGGKIIGAGGGGCLLFVVYPEKRKEFLDKMDSLLHIDFKIDFEGTSQL